jgi:hypothetical protein
LRIEAGIEVVERMQQNAIDIINGNDISEVEIKHISSLPKAKRKIWPF